MEQFKDMESSKVFEMFHELSQVPRESKHEEKVSNWLKEWATKRNLEVIQDDVLNIIIKKSGTGAAKNAPTTVLQAHMDMVCEKGKDSNHDFSKDAIEWVIKDDYIYANNTTLGADDGIGVAYALAVLDDDSIEHPPLEVLITVDEETGMTGANNLDPKALSGKIFINIDSEEEGAFYMSCAGGNNTEISIPVKFEKVAGTLVELEATGLLGGHSGLEIIKDRANASKLMGRMLNMIVEASIEFNLVEINGGTKFNAITRDNLAKIVVDEADIAKIEDLIKTINIALKDEYTPQDPDAHIELRKQDKGTFDAMIKEDTLRVVNGLVLVPNGPTHYSKYIDGLVQTSTNMGIVKTEASKVTFVGCLRSSIISQKQALVEQHNVIGKVINAEVTHSSFYPAWPYKTDSKIKDIFLNDWKKLFNNDAQVVAIHAGLECGIFRERLGSDIDFISFGPDIEGAHTAEEHVSIPSIDRNWKLLKAVLSSIKEY